MAAEARKKSASTVPGPFDALLLRDRLAAGQLSVADAAEACLARIRETDDNIGAWAFLDPDHVMRQAEALDRHRKSGRPIGALHGVPVGLKDIIDTADMPTENGTVIDSGRRPRRDAYVTAKLRAGGALIMGKTVTTELAYFSANQTRNPHDPGRTPGGSSSGSAAAVAAGMVPLAVGTQTAGSVIRPASFCGVFGYKPTHGLIPRTGVLGQAPELDTVGTFAQTLDGAALLAEAMQGFDPQDVDTRVEAHHHLLEDCRSEPPLKPLFAFVRQPAWEQADNTTKEAFGELVDALGDRCDEVDLPELFVNGAPAQLNLQMAGLARSYRGYYEKAHDRLSARMREAIDEGRAILAQDYLTARDWREVLNSGLDEIFNRYDAILTPAAPGEAPLGLESTGDPAFCRLWTLCGTPAVSLPLMTGPAGMPLGVQLVGRRGWDGRLLRTARWLVEHLSAEAKE
jgi:Asp-tRNA(Asn)/Glu-tRNA(Gln) amidotransferase A subunit family amidase